MYAEMTKNALYNAKKRIPAAASGIAAVSVVTIHRIPSVRQIHHLPVFRELVRKPRVLLDEPPASVEIDNSSHVKSSFRNKSNVYPQSADFTFYGGLYRGLNLISVPEVHFELMYWGSNGLKVTATPTQCGGASAHCPCTADPDDGSHRAAASEHHSI